MTRTTAGMVGRKALRLAQSGPITVAEVASTMGIAEATALDAVRRTPGLVREGSIWRLRRPEDPPRRVQTPRKVMALRRLRAVLREPDLAELLYAYGLKRPDLLADHIDAILRSTP